MSRIILCACGVVPAERTIADSLLDMSINILPPVHEVLFI